MDFPCLGLTLTVTPMASLINVEPIEMVIVPMPELQHERDIRWTNNEQHFAQSSPEVPDHDSSSRTAPTVLSELVLDTNGALETGDLVTFQDGSLYDEYSIEGEEGQSLLITLESDEFDPYLVLLNHTGTILAVNDDVTPENTDSSLFFTLPDDDEYWVVASSFKRNSRGQYRLTIWTLPKEAETLPLPLEESP